jgi:hypothetical protein
MPGHDPYLDGLLGQQKNRASFAFLLEPELDQTADGF